MICAAGGAHTAVAVKTAGPNVPIVFSIGSDPVKFGLVTSLNRPGGNVTGVSFFTAELEPKRLGLLHSVVPQATSVGALINPTDANAKDQAKDLADAAQALGVQLHVLHATNEREIEAAFVGLWNGVAVRSLSRQIRSAVVRRRLYRWPRAIPFRRFMNGGSSWTKAD